MAEFETSINIGVDDSFSDKFEGMGRAAVGVLAHIDEAVQHVVKSLGQLQAQLRGATHTARETTASAAEAAAVRRTEITTHGRTEVAGIKAKRDVDVETIRRQADREIAAGKRDLADRELLLKEGELLRRREKEARDAAARDADRDARTQAHHEDLVERRKGRKSRERTARYLSDSRAEQQEAERQGKLIEHRQASALRMAEATHRANEKTRSTIEVMDERERRSAVRSAATSATAAAKRAAREAETLDLLQRQTMATVGLYPETRPGRTGRYQETGQGFAAVEMGRGRQQAAKAGFWLEMVPGMVPRRAAYSVLEPEPPRPVMTGSDALDLSLFGTTPVAQARGRLQFERERLRQLQRMDRAQRIGQMELGRDLGQTLQASVRSMLAVGMRGVDVLGNGIIGGLQLAQRGMANMTHRAQAFATRGAALGSVVGAVAFYGSQRALRGVLDVTTQRQQQLLSLVNTLGSQAEVDRVFSEVRRVAKKPGMDIESALQGYIKLAVVGSPDALNFRLLTEVANQVARSGGGPEQMKLAMLGVEQTFGKGRFSAEELQRQIFPVAPMMRTGFQRAFGGGGPEDWAKRVEAQGLTMTQAWERVVAQLEQMPRAVGSTRNAWVNLVAAIREGSIFFGKGLIPADAEQRLDRFTKRIEAAWPALGKLGEKARDLGMGLSRGLAGLPEFETVLQRLGEMDLGVFGQRLGDGIAWGVEKGRQGIDFLVGLWPKVRAGAQTAFEGVRSSFGVLRDWWGKFASENDLSAGLGRLKAQLGDLLSPASMATGAQQLVGVLNDALPGIVDGSRAIASALKSIPWEHIAKATASGMEWLGGAMRRHPTLTNAMVQLGLLRAADQRMGGFGSAAASGLFSMGGGYLGWLIAQHKMSGLFRNELGTLVQGMARGAEIEKEVLKAAGTSRNRWLGLGTVVAGTAAAAYGAYNVMTGRRATGGEREEKAVEPARGRRVLLGGAAPRKVAYFGEPVSDAAGGGTGWRWRWTPRERDEREEKAAAFGMMGGGLAFSPRAQRYLRGYEAPTTVPEFMASIGVTDPSEYDSVRKAVEREAREELGARTQRSGMGRKGTRATVTRSGRNLPQMAAPGLRGGRLSDARRWLTDFEHLPEPPDDFDADYQSYDAARRRSAERRAAIVRKHELFEEIGKLEYSLEERANRHVVEGYMSPAEYIDARYKFVRRKGYDKTDVYEGYRAVPSMRRTPLIDTQTGEQVRTKRGRKIWQRHPIRHKTWEEAVEQYRNYGLSKYLPADYKEGEPLPAKMRLVPQRIGTIDAGRSLWMPNRELFKASGDKFAFGRFSPSQSLDEWVMEVVLAESPYGIYEGSNIGAANEGNSYHAQVYDEILRRSGHAVAGRVDVNAPYGSDEWDRYAYEWRIKLREAREELAELTADERERRAAMDARQLRAREVRAARQRKRELKSEWKEKEAARIRREQEKAAAEEAKRQRAEERAAKKAEAEAEKLRRAQERQAAAEARKQRAEERRAAKGSKTASGVADTEAVVRQQVEAARAEAQSAVQGARATEQERVASVAPEVVSPPASTPGTGALRKHNIPWVDLGGVRNEAPVVRIATRDIVVLDINGKRVPFYLSTGSGGKKLVPAGKWYPFFGIGEDDWFNKGAYESEIASYYQSDVLRKAAEQLDLEIGDTRHTSAAPQVGHLRNRTYIDAINQGLRPVDAPRTYEENLARDANIRETLRAIDPSAAERYVPAASIRPPASAPAPEVAPPPKRVPAPATARERVASFLRRGGERAARYLEAGLPRLAEDDRLAARIELDRWRAEQAERPLMRPKLLDRIGERHAPSATWEEPVASELGAAEPVKIRTAEPARRASLPDHLRRVTRDEADEMIARARSRRAAAREARPMARFGRWFGRVMHAVERPVAAVTGATLGASMAGDAGLPWWAKVGGGVGGAWLGWKKPAPAFGASIGYHAGEGLAESLGVEGGGKTAMKWGMGGAGLGAVLAAPWALPAFIGGELIGMAGNWAVNRWDVSGQDSTPEQKAFWSSVALRRRAADENKWWSDRRARAAGDPFTRKGAYDWKTGRTNTGLTMADFQHGPSRWGYLPEDQIDRPTAFSPTEWKADPGAFARVAALWGRETQLATAMNYGAPQPDANPMAGRNWQFTKPVAGQSGGEDSWSGGQVRHIVELGPKTLSRIDEGQKASFERHMADWTAEVMAGGARP